MAINITKACRLNHHQYSAIMNRIEKARAAEKLAEQNPPKNPAAKEPNNHGKR